MKIVINTCHGGYGLSKEAVEYLAKKGVPEAIIELEKDRFYGYILDDDRSNPLLVEVVEKLGDSASGDLSSLEVIEIPDDVEWQIEEYDGAEWIAEKHRTWE